MLLQQKLGKSAEVLKKVYSLLEGKDIFWILTGRASLILQGIDYEMNDDLDILTDENGANMIFEIMQNYATKNLEYCGNEKYKSRFATYEIDGINIDVMGEMQHKNLDGSRSKIKGQKNSEYKIFNLENMEIKILSLEDELDEYEQMGRTEKAEKIIEKLKNEK